MGTTTHWYVMSEEGKLRTLEAALSNNVALISLGLTDRNPKVRAKALQKAASNFTAFKDIIINSLKDEDDDVRLEAIRCLMVSTDITYTTVEGWRNQEESRPHIDLYDTILNGWWS